MICVYIHYTAGTLLANSFFDRSTPLKQYDEMMMMMTIQHESGRRIDIF